MTDTSRRYHTLTEQLVDVVVDHMLEAYKELTGRTLPTREAEALFELIRFI